MIRRISCLLIAFSVLAVGCSGSDEVTEPPRPSFTVPTTTSTLPTTTTTTPMSISKAPPGLVEVIDAFYSYALGESSRAPAAPKRLIKAIVPAAVERPTRGRAFLGTFAKRRLAVVELEDDVFLAIKNESGWRILGGQWPSLALPAFYGAAPRIVAVVGSDARPGQNVEQTRADSIHFVALDGAGGGAIVGVPRDSYVPISGFGRGKITTSLSLGGPETMMATFEDLTDLPLEGYVLTGFSGFQSLLGTVLGGVTVDIPFSINDRWAHVALQAGRQMLDGAEALGFARARKTVPRGDFTRSEHQGLILLAAAHAVQEAGISSIPKLLEKSEPYLHTNLTPGELFTFSAMVETANLETVVNVVAPGSAGWAGSASVVYLSSSVDELWTDLADAHLED